jgi:hypothetical protein
MKFASCLKRAAALLSAAALAVLGGCGGGGGSSGSSTGTMSVALTDNPACGYDNVYVTVEKLRVHQNSVAADTDGGWQEIVLNPAKRIDLLSLTNGILENLGQTSLPAGTYTQLRLVLATNSGAPWANAVVPTGGSEMELKTPSGQQSGLKANVNMSVAANQVADFVIDFDACKSIVIAGNSGQRLLKPVLTVIPLMGNAGQRIVGYIDPATAGAATTVSAQNGGNVVKATPPDATGKFTLYPVPAGNYDLAIVSTDKTTAVVTGVPVSDTAVTNIGSDTVRIALTASPGNSATGVVKLNNSTVNTGASVRALQDFSGGPTVETAATAVDADTGAYALALPTAAPVKTAYVSNPASFSFAADATAAGKYTLEASIDGLAAQTAAIDLSAGGVATDFLFTAP